MPAAPIKKTPTPIKKTPAPTPAAPPAEAAEGPTKKELRYKADPQVFLRRSDFQSIRSVLHKPEMTWAEFCDIKIKAFTDHWTLAKKNPQAVKVGRKPKAITDPVKLAKIKAAHEASKLREARYAEMIALSEAAIAEASK